MSACPFCDTGSLETWIDIDCTSYALKPLNPVVDGHILVVPYEHVETFMEFPALTADVVEAAAGLAKELGGDWNLIASAGASATQTVKHLHVHLVPRHDGDGLHLPWTGQKITAPGPPPVRDQDFWAFP